MVEFVNFMLCVLKSFEVAGIRTYICMHSEVISVTQCILIIKLMIISTIIYCVDSAQRLNNCGGCHGDQGRHHASLTQLTLHAHIDNLEDP